MPSPAFPPGPRAFTDTRLYYGPEPAHGSLYWTGGRRMPWLDQVAQQITHLSTLAPGWDGHRARTIDHRTLLNAWSFLEQVAEIVTTAPSLVPTVSGGVAVEWHRNGVDLEIEFGGREVLVSYEDADGNDKEGPIGTNADLVILALAQVR